jgi:hypothetical protein
MIITIYSTAPEFKVNRHADVVIVAFVAPVFKADDASPHMKMTTLPPFEFE